MILIKIYYHLMSNLKKFFYKIIYGKRVKFGRKVTFRKNFSLIIEKDGNVEIGDGVFFNNYCTICSRENIKIGNNTLFGENVKIYDNNHVFKYKGKLIKKQGFKTSKIVIGSNCWIGNSVNILKGINIGDNSVVGANEIVKNSIESDSILNNGKVSKIIFTQ